MRAQVLGKSCILSKVYERTNSKRTSILAQNLFLTSFSVTKAFIII
jgi:hypothetical protein